MATERLPNPNVDHLEGQHTTLREALVHQEDTAMWSRNTDINTFKGMVTSKENLEKINRDGVAGLNKPYFDAQDLKEERRSLSFTEAFNNAFAVLGSSFDKFRMDLNGFNFSSFTDSFSAGSVKIKAGMKELTNGLGVMGPIINNLKTALYKVQAVFNVLAGVMQMVFGFIPKLFSRLFERNRDKDDKELAKLEEDINQLTQQRDGDKTEHTKKMEALMVKLHPDSIHALDSIINGSGSGGSSATYFDDYRLEEEQRQHSERQKKYDKEIYELEKKRQKALARKDRMNSMFGFAKFAIMLAALVAIVILLRDKIGSLFTGIFNELKANGYFGAIGNAASQFTTRTAALFDDLASRLKNLLGKGNQPSLGSSNKPQGPGINNPANSGTRVSSILGTDGRPITYEPKLKDPLIKIPKVTGDKVVSMFEGVGKSLNKVAGFLKFGGGALEAGVDVVLNEREYSKVKEAYEKQIDVERGDGTKRPISDEEMEAVDNVMINNRAGSVGRGTGALAGGALMAPVGVKAGGAVGMFIAGPPGAAVGSAITGLAFGIGGAIVGGIFGDEALTNMSEYFTGTDNSQEILSGEGKASGEALQNAEDAAKAAALAAEEQRATANSNVVMDSSTRNFIQQETMFHGGQTDKQDVMKQNSYFQHYPIVPLGF